MVPSAISYSRTGVADRVRDAAAGLSLSAARCLQPGSNTARESDGRANSEGAWPELAEPLRPYQNFNTWRTKLGAVSGLCRARSELGCSWVTMAGAFCTSSAGHPLSRAANRSLIPRALLLLQPRPWRILVGEDAHRLDDVVRRLPERAYDLDSSRASRARSAGA